MLFIVSFLLNNSLSPMPGVVPFTPVITTNETSTNPINGLMKARVVYDYDAKDATELSLMADEVI